MAHVLLVEPDKILAQNTTKFLRKRGWKVSWQPAAGDAIESADQAQPDIVVLDLQLAGHSGVEFMHEFRSYGDWQHLPVVIYSSLHPDELGGRELAMPGLSVQAYVHKTESTLSELAETLENLLASQSEKS